MKTSSFFKSLSPLLIGFAVVVTFVLGIKVQASEAASTRYVITNDDVPPLPRSSVTFYTVGKNGSLTPKKKVETNAFGIAGGYFGLDRIAVAGGKLNCVFASDSQSPDIVGIDVAALKAVSRTKGSKSDDGSSNGIGLALSSHYLYASFTDNGVIGTFKLQPGCKLKFISDITVGGLHGGIIDAMAIRGNILVATYGDGSIQSFNIAKGVPISNGDEQDSTGSRGGNTYPNGIDITQDGHFAIFGDTSVSTVVEVSDLSSGKLTPTIVYHLGSGISSSNILLSPDETLLYISNTQGDRISAAFFDKATGKLTKGCASGSLRGYSSNWSYLAGLTLATSTGSGGTVYAAEFGSPSSIAVVNVQSSAGKCSLKEASTSPVADPNSPGLLSIGSFPPRRF
jgi:6-phosphogluconolactonase (cycloisomerase 2 family)